MLEVKPILVKTYQQMAEHTEPECASNCKLPRTCCDAFYCEMAAQWAKQEYGIVLKPTGHPTLPFMGPNGCTVEPHLRPVCTVHVCSINTLGFKPGDEAWTEKYFELRERIDELEAASLDDIIAGEVPG